MTELCDLVAIEPLPPVMVRVILIDSSSGEQVACLLDCDDAIEVVLGRYPAAP
jgi:hypothetical protein